ncbi:hypothetical protein [Pedobacter jeongneungensis]|uniref:hypothetical protein n=1 Tax=Pedobacter jeongneungensis TaxID=947309 RepID=UPI000469976A|nr:hypothetical protein [Pedobacter jeongneungensis]
MKTLFILFFVSIGIHAYAQNKSGLDQRLIGKWKTISKIETDKTNGAVTESDKELYKAGEKTYEFTKKNTVIITQGFGKHREELPAVSDGNKLFIGKPNKNKTPYLITFQQNKISLLKTETKTKKGKTIVETEEVLLQR